MILLLLLGLREGRAPVLGGRFRVRLPVVETSETAESCLIPNRNFTERVP